MNVTKWGTKFYLYIKRKITKKMLIRHPGSVPDQYRINTSQKKKKILILKEKKTELELIL